MSRFEHMVNATQLSCVSIWTLGCYATVLCLSIWTHGECYATVLRNFLASLDLNTWCVLRNCLVSLDLNTWWMLRNCLVFLDLNTWWMLRNCLVPRFQRMDATQLSCVSRYFEKLNIDLMLRQHYECAICAVICTFFITSLLSDLSVPCNYYDMCIWYPYFNFFSVFIYFRACHNRSE